jgi:perosamine synthetase
MEIPVTRPYLGDEEAAAVNKVLESGWLIQGPKVFEFEKTVCKYTGAKFARASSSCTTALHLGLLSLGIGPGDEVLLPSFSFVATANAVEYTGAKPVFIDIDLKTFNIDPSKIEKYLSKAKRQDLKVKAIMPVHLFGLCADMKPIMELAAKYKLFVIEDAACALGSLYNSKHAGTFGNVGCFSFHPRKSITTGEGGMLVTANAEIAARVQSLRNHGIAISKLTQNQKYSYAMPAFDILGYNYRMTDIQGAIGIEQMAKLPWIIENRIEKAVNYDTKLMDTDWLDTPFVPKCCKHTFQSYVALIRRPGLKQLTPETIQTLNLLRNKFMAYLKKKGVSTRQGTHAVHTLTYYKTKYNIKDTDYLNSFAADRLSVTLPLYPQMTKEEQDYVIEQVTHFR